jgi:thioredoxin-like negative regulator of GroEL
VARHIDLELKTLIQNTQIVWKQTGTDAPVERRTQLAAISYRLLPDDPEIAFQYARVLAETGQGEFALRVLGEAVKKGLKDTGRLQQDSAFAKLRANPAFQKLAG